MPVNRFTRIQYIDPLLSISYLHSPSQPAAAMLDVGRCRPLYRRAVEDFHRLLKLRDVGEIQSTERTHQRPHAAPTR